MGKGIQLAREAGAGMHADVLDNLKEQLLIVFLKRLKALGHPLTFPVTEIDDAGQDMVSYSVDPFSQSFTFTLEKKS